MGDGDALKLSMVVRNMIEYPSDGKTEKEGLMEKHTNLILTGWGHAEYVTAAAVALKALKGDADVMGVSRRRLPELMEEIAERKKGDRWSVIYLLGVALIGDPPRLAAALAKLKEKGVKVTWISALEIPEEAAEALNGLMEVKVFDLTLLEAVGHVFGADVGPYMPFLKEPKRVSAETREYFTLIAAAQFYYRNYQDEGLYATTARYLASGVKPCAWEPSVRAAVEHCDRYGGRELVGKSREITTLQDRINRVAAHEHARVLILGESGTGKETVAQ